MVPNKITQDASVEMKRRSLWKAAVEQELQELVATASDVRQKINTAKTKTKRDFYQKKFDKIQPRVMQMVAALQHMQAKEPPAEPTPLETASEITVTNEPSTPASV